MVHEFLGFTRSVIGSKKFPSDSTLNNMKKSHLIDLLHTAQHNFESLNWFYCNAVKWNERNFPIPNWIPCSERLPENEDYVLVCGGYDDVFIAFFEEESQKWRYNADDDTYYYVEVFAWMPLPEPYKGEGAENG